MTTKQIIESQKLKINAIIHEYIDEYLFLCESEIEKLFLTNLFFYYFLGKFSVNRDFKNNELILFSDFNQVIIDEFDDEYCLYRGIIRNDKQFGNFKYKNIGITLIEKQELLKHNGIGFDNTISSNEYSFIPQYRVDIEGSIFRIDIGLIFCKYKNSQKLKEKKIAIECDGFEYHSSKESLRNDSIRTRKLMSAGWNVIRYSGSEIYSTQDYSEIHELIKEIKKIINNNT